MASCILRALRTARVTDHRTLRHPWIVGAAHEFGRIQLAGGMAGSWQTSTTVAAISVRKPRRIIGQAAGTRGPSGSGSRTRRTACGAGTTRAEAARAASARRSAATGRTRHITHTGDRGIRARIGGHRAAA